MEASTTTISIWSGLKAVSKLKAYEAFNNTLWLLLLLLFFFFFNLFLVLCYPTVTWDSLLLYLAFDIYTHYSSPSRTLANTETIYIYMHRQIPVLWQNCYNILIVGIVNTHIYIRKILRWPGPSFMCQLQQPNLPSLDK